MSENEPRYRGKALRMCLSTRSSETAPVVALPNGRPVWGGTYYRKKQWLSALEQISDLYNRNPEKLHEYANKLEQGIKAMDMITVNTNEADFNIEFIDETVKNWSQYFDRELGGLKRAPKFMMPNNYHFLLRYAYTKHHKELQEFVNLTLTKMAYGGLYDQVGGGFSRYATSCYARRFSVDGCFSKSRYVLYEIP